jgi:multidrug resistance efflux pump
MTPPILRPWTAARRLLPYTWILGLATLAASVGGAGWLLRSQAADKRETSAGTSESAPTLVVCRGIVDVEGGMRQLVPLLAQPTRVRGVNVQEGQVIDQAGVELLKIDDTIPRTNLERAEADLKDADILLDQAKRSADKHQLEVDAQELAISAAQHNLDAANSMNELVKKNRKLGHLSLEEENAAAEKVKSAEDALKAEQLKRKKLDLEKPEEDITHAEQKVKEKKAVREQAQYMLDQCSLKAPCPGLVIRVNVNPGDLLGPQPHQAAILFCPSTPRIIRAEEEQEFAGRVHVGQVAMIQDAESGRGSWRGKVVRLSDVYTQRRSTALDSPFQFNDVRTREFIIQLDEGQPQPSINQRMRVELGGS